MGLDAGGSFRGEIFIRFEQQAAPARHVSGSCSDRSTCLLSEDKRHETVIKTSSLPEAAQSLINTVLIGFIQAEGWGLYREIVYLSLCSRLIACCLAFHKAHNAIKPSFVQRTHTVLHKHFTMT